MTGDYAVHPLDTDDGGKLAVEMQTGSPYWYARMRPPGASSYTRKSTKERDLPRAIQQAVRLYDALKVGTVPTFCDVASSWLAELEVSVAQGRCGKNSYRDYKPKVERFFIPFFGEKKITQITNADVKAFWNWRWTYWTTGPGKDIAIEYERGGISLKRPAPRSNPTLNTLRKEIIPLRGIFQLAVDRQLIPPLAVPDAAAMDINPRMSHSKSYPAFRRSQLRMIYKAAWRRIAVSPTASAQERYYRAQLYYFVNLVASTGIRPGVETVGLTWGDIQTTHNTRDEEVVGLKVLNGKRKGGSGTKYRWVVLGPRLRYRLRRWRRQSPYALDNHPIFAHPDGTPIREFDGSFSRLLESIGLTHHEDGRKFVPYSLRATYATLMLARGVDPWQVARQMGHTNPEMLRKHYGQENALDYVASLAAML